MVLLDEEAYFSSNPPPADLSIHTTLASSFISHHLSSPTPRRIALVTSGGTTVPLEHNTVRFIDNFSSGTRGATSAEHFLEAGYAVIFLHRRFSLLPYARRYSHAAASFLDCLEETPSSPGSSSTLRIAKGSEWSGPGLVEVLRQYTHAKQHNLLLQLPFTTISDYLWLLRTLARQLRPLGPLALVYLAAAPSDFFIPPERMETHKIQSTRLQQFGNFDEAAAGVQGMQQLVIQLDPVPKLLKNLIDGWAPAGFFVSFKLETDPTLLVRKAKLSLERYQHHLVVGNLLATRKWEVVFVAPERPEQWLRVPVKGEEDVPDQIEDNSTERQPLNPSLIAGKEPAVEIESLIVPAIQKLHDEHIRLGERS